MLNILFYICFATLIVGSFPLWRNAIRQQRTEGSLMTSRETAGSPIGFLDVIVMFFFWLVGQAVSIVLIQLIFEIRIEALVSQSGDTISWSAIVMAAGQLVATALAMGVFLLRYRKLSVIGWQTEFIQRDVLLGLLTFVMVIPAILIMQWLLVKLFAYEHPTMDMLENNANGLTLLASWFSAVIVAPICEEIFFRGVLQSWLQRLRRGASDNVLTGGWDSQSSLMEFAFAKPKSESQTGNALPATSDNPYQSPRGNRQVKSSISKSESSWTNEAFWPIVVTSVLFGLAHFGQGPAPITLFLFGLALGYLYRRTGSIVPCIVLHMMLNAFSMFWFTLQVFWGKPDAVAILEQVRSATQCF